MWFPGEYRELAAHHRAHRGRVRAERFAGRRAALQDAVRACVAEGRHPGKSVVFRMPGFPRPIRVFRLQRDWRRALHENGVRSMYG